MKWLTLKLIKANSRIDTDYDDELLVAYGDSAEQQVLNDTRRTHEELVAMGEDGKVPADILHASLMLADFAYRQRCMVDQLQWYNVPYTYDKLIKPYVRLTDRTQPE